MRLFRKTKMGGSNRNRANMADPVALDLYIQDFVTTNKLLNSHYPWNSLVNRQFVDDGLTKVLSFQSGGSVCYAVAQHVALPDADWLRIELTRAIPDIEEHRFDCLRMMQSGTHVGLEVEKISTGVIVKMTTRHRGLVNVAFVIRDGLALGNPFLV
jgi:hypothetical protein